MRRYRPLTAAFSAVLLASLGSAAPLGASAPAAGEQAKPATTTASGPHSRATTTGQVRLPDGHSIARRPMMAPGKNPPAASDPHTVLLKLQPGTGAAERDRLVASVHGIVAQPLDNGYLKITTTAGTPAAAVKKLSASPAVAAAELDRVRYLTATPNDPYYSYQTNLPTIRMPLAWNLQRSASNVIVAVVDTGVDAGHPDLVGRTVTGYNAVTPGASTADTQTHGTFVAGIIAANTNNGVGMAGVTWNGRVMPIKVFSGDTALDSDIAEGITWAVDHGAKVINLSLGGPGDNSVLHDSIKYAVSKGAVVVAAAGNSGNGVLQYPAAYPEVISVAATDDAGNLTDFSSYGEHIDVAAPGFDVFSTIPRDPSCNPSYCYGLWTGTSFSAPQVAGVAALLKQKHPTWTPAQIASQITTTARDGGPRGFDPYYGWGVLDAYAALGGAGAAAFPQRALGANEPNDVPARATTLTPGSATAGFIGMEGDADWYKLPLQSDGTLTVYATPPSFIDTQAQNLDVVLDVYDSKLDLVGHSDGATWDQTESFSMLVPKDTYYVRITSYNGAADLRTYQVTPYFTPQPPTVVPPFTGTDYNAASGGSPKAVAVGDLTGDGRTDVLVITSSYAGGSIMLDPQRADGSFNAADFVLSSAIDSLEPTGVAVLDATGDGKLDAVISTAGGIEVHAQNDSGGLQAGVSIADTAGVHDLTAADMDGDGDQDLVAYGNDIVLLTQGPAGVFTATTVAAGGAFRGETEVGDLDGDGRIDIASFGNASSVDVHYNKADGWTHTAYAVSGTPYAVTIADVTNDGLADLAVVGAFTNPQTLDVLKQQADHTLTLSQTLESSSPTGVVAMDWDRDGRTDLVAGGDGGPVMLYRQQNDGTLAASVSSPIRVAQWPTADSLAVADLNGDTYPDLAIAMDWGAGFVAAYNTNGTPPPPGITIPLGVQSVVMDASVPDFGTGATRSVTRITIKTAPGLDPATFSRQTVQLINARTGLRVSATVTYNGATGTLTLTHVVSLGGRLRYLPLVARGTPYRLIINGVKDTAGNPNPGFSLSFLG